MILHELYFDTLGRDGDPDTVLKDVLTRDFGSVDRWRSEFVAMGKALGGGSGWVLLTYSSRDGNLINQWAADHRFRSGQVGLWTKADSVTAFDDLVIRGTAVGG